MVTFSDPDSGDTHDVTWNWGDGSPAEDDMNATSPASRTHTYAEPGVYTVGVTVTDAAGAADSGSYEFIIIFYPEGGFVTGGGWIDSPAGAYAPDPSLTGKATFGFISKYKKGANIPIGHTEFQFKTGDLNFQSDTYAWLVVNQGGTSAQIKGEGTIDGLLDPYGSPYKFMLWAGDGSPDTFRIKIWYEIPPGEVVLYDNGSKDPITNGSIVIHSGG
jgi:PKD repeat protein